MALETYSLLREIQNHDAISGAALGERFGVSRAAISKRLKELRVMRCEVAISY